MTITTSEIRYDGIGTHVLCKIQRVYRPKNKSASYYGANVVGPWLRPDDPEANSYRPQMSPSTITLSSADIAERAKSFTVLVTCRPSQPATTQIVASPENPGDTIEQQTRRFVLFVKDLWSSPNTEALAALDAIYEDEVMYCGKKTKKDAIIKEKTGIRSALASA